MEFLNITELMIFIKQRIKKTISFALNFIGLCFRAKKTTKQKKGNDNKVIILFA